MLTDNEPENIKTTEKTINSENRASKSSELPYFHAMMEAKRQTKTEHAKPQISIQFSKLEQIRNDASEICDNLLTDDDVENIKTREKTINSESRKNTPCEPLYFHAKIEADSQTKTKHANPKINIQFSKLEQIRKDASVVCDNLLTEEELWETKRTKKQLNLNLESKNPLMSS